MDAIRNSIKASFFICFELIFQFFIDPQIRRSTNLSNIFGFLNSESAINSICLGEFEVKPCSQGRKILN